jgi:hypothetical protein
VLLLRSFWVGWYDDDIANDVPLLRSYRTTNNKYPILTMCRSYGAFGLDIMIMFFNDVSLLRSFGLDGMLMILLTMCRSYGALGWVV